MPKLALLVYLPVAVLGAPQWHPSRLVPILSRHSRNRPQCVQNPSLYALATPSNALGAASPSDATRAVTNTSPPPRSLGLHRHTPDSLGIKYRYTRRLVKVDLQTIVVQVARAVDKTTYAPRPGCTYTMPHSVMTNASVWRDG